MKSCSQCAFSARRSAHSFECRIRAPERNGFTNWPTVGVNDWCGEFQPAESPPVVQWPTPNLDPLGAA